MVFRDTWVDAWVGSWVGSLVDVWVRSLVDVWVGSLVDVWVGLRPWRQSCTTPVDRYQRQRPDRSDKLALRMRPCSSVHITFNRNSLPWTGSTVMDVPRSCMPESRKPVIE